MEKEIRGCTNDSFYRQPGFLTFQVNHCVLLTGTGSDAQLHRNIMDENLNVSE